jgi:hypothetical protein
VRHQGLHSNLDDQRAIHAVEDIDTLAVHNKGRLWAVLHRLKEVLDIQELEDILVLKLDAPLLRRVGGDDGREVQKEAPSFPTQVTYKT